MKTQAALAAKALKAEVLKAFPGIKVRVTSDNFSMGDSVNLYLTDQPPAVMAAVNEMARKYQYGRFDGMTDMYESDNGRDDLPQSKYVFVNNNMTDEKRQSIWSEIRVAYANDLPADYTSASGRTIQGEYVADIVWQLFAGTRRPSTLATA